VTTLDLKLVIFARRLQNVAAKSIPLDIKVRKFVKLEKAEKIGILDAGAVAAVATRAAEKVTDALVAVGDDKDSREVFSAFEKGMLPLSEGERLVNRFQASTRFMPCCKLPSGDYFCKPQCGIPVMCATCGVRPLMSSESSIVTSHAIYHLGRTSSFPWPCIKALVPPKQAGFVVAWAPIRAFRGQSFCFKASGVLPKHEKGIFGGKYKKRPGPSAFSFGIQFEDFVFIYSGSKPDRNWLVDDELLYEQHVFDQVQLTLLGAGAQPPEIPLEPDVEEGAGGLAVAVAVAENVSNSDGDSNVTLANK